ncbi:TetR family transcriptional regulator C-terminal domain-containing protein [Pleurocapsa sp. FMAR1]|uniref:TetR family transcriptional regulator C-terminal domain-containing protein n=1 Tax=Pleurocapsa sp. FMAR1 TaxID=3040204 RepID=UPI0029C8B4DE|nr:TetR family transcriptional regulator C-terminal domain-containing protein [Pleurocapsa sp. FMAR1]
MNRANKRNELIQVGKEIVVQQGFKGTSLNDVLTKAGVPKGSFYYYFSSKEDFGLAIVDDFAQEYRDRFKTFLEDEKYSPLTRLRNYFEFKIAEMEAHHCNNGCLIGNLAQELSTQNELFRDRLNQIFAEWEQYFIRCLKAAYEAGEIEDICNFEVLAKFILSSWEGAILQAKVMKSTVPMQIFIKILFQQVLSISDFSKI